MYAYVFIIKVMLSPFRSILPEEKKENISEIYSEGAKIAGRGSKDTYPMTCCSFS